MPAIEFEPTMQQVVAVFTSPMDSGETFDAPLTIGVYPGSNSEIWLELDGAKFNVQLADVPTLCKQLKRAARVASEQEAEA